MGLAGSRMEMMDRNAAAIMVGLVVPHGSDGNLMEMMDWNTGNTTVALVVPNFLMAT